MERLLSSSPPQVHKRILFFGSHINKFPCARGVDKEITCLTICTLVKFHCTCAPHRVPFTQEVSIKLDLLKRNLLPKLKAAEFISGGAEFVLIENQQKIRSISHLDQVDDLLPRLAVTLDVSLGDRQRRVSCQNLHVTQRTTNRADLLGSVGDEGAATAVR